MLTLRKVSCTIDNGHYGLRYHERLHFRPLCIKAHHSLMEQIKFLHQLLKLTRCMNNVNLHSYLKAIEYTGRPPMEKGVFPDEVTSLFFDLL